MASNNYTDVTVEPDLDKIHADVAVSSMTDKAISWCLWDEDTATLNVEWDQALGAGDKTILDGIVAGA